jgi:hypothetical protein
MLLYRLLKKVGHFQLTKALINNPIFRVRMQIKQFRSIFAYAYREFGGKLLSCFHPSKIREKKNKNKKRRYMI